jgi:lipopolysaccharide exporter
MNADYFLLSRMATLSTLAVYYNAFRLATLPGLLVGNVIQQVTFSTFSASRTADELRRQFLESLRLSATLAFPAALGLIVSAQFAIAVVYGPGWEVAVPVLRMLSIMGLTRSLQIIGPSVLLARGHTGVNLSISMAYMATLLPAFWLAVPRGAMGVAAAWVVVAAPLDIAVLVLGGRAAGVGARDLLTTMAPPAYRALTMAVLVAALLEPLGRPGPAVAATQTLLGLGAIAGGAMFFVAWTLWREPDMRRRALVQLRWS